jgi:arylsulfatase A-like enzyme
MKRPLRRDILLGVALFGVLFALDAAESWYHVQAALRRVNADPAGNEVLELEVARFIVGMLVGYLALGLYAGLVHAAWQRLVLPRRPGLAGVLVLALVAVLANARQIIRQPALHDWFLFRSWFVDHVPPQVPLAGLLLVVGGSVLVGWVRSRGAADFSSRLGPLLLLAVPPLLAWHVPGPDPAPANPGPNIVILSWDAFRPDHVGWFGYERKITPNIDAFLDESAVWVDAYTPLARTYPAWVSLLTGTFPTTHGIRDPLPAPEHLVPPVPTLPQVLRDRGWFTSFLTDDSRFSYMVPEMGFDAIEEPKVGIANFAISGSEPRFRAFYGLLDNPLGWLLVPVIRMNEAFGRSYRSDWFDRTTRQAIADAAKHDKFFLAIHDCTLHSPADRHWPYSMLFDQRGYEGDNRFRYLSLGSVSVGDAQPEEAEKLAASQNINLYDAGVVMVDRAFARLRAQLEENGLWKTSIVVLMSDHGEDFYQPDQRYRFVGPNHGFHPWGQGQHRVMLAIHWPEQMRRPIGRQKNLASLVDVVPTLTESLGFLWEGDGRSLFDVRPRTLYTETGVTEPNYWPRGHRTYPFRSTAQFYTVDPATTRVYARPEFVDDVIHTKDRFVMDERWKLVWYAMKFGTKVELFDWRADPDNVTDVAADYPDVVARLWPVLRERLRADGEAAPDALVATVTP